MNFLIKTLYPVFCSVISSSIKASILILAILLVRVLMKRRVTFKFSYILWLIVILRIIIPDLYKCNISIYRYVPEINRGIAIVETRDKNIGDIAIKEDSSALPNGKVHSENIPYDNNKINPSINLKYIALIIWLIGLSTIMGTTLIINLRFLRKISKDEIINQPSIMRIFNRCREEMGISKNILLVETNRLKTVGLMGVLSPRILFPYGLVSSLNEDNLRYIFLHELSHLKRRDILINWITSILTAIHWFNPIIWYGFYKMREDIELCCDSLVMICLKEDEEINYGYTIVKLAESISIKSPMIITASVVGSKAQIKRRIKMIKLFQKDAYKLSAAAILVVALVGIIAFVGIEHGKNNVDSKNNIVKENIAGKKEVKTIGDKASDTKLRDYEIIVYNTHSNELYKNGISAMEVGKRLVKGLGNEGFKTSFIEVPVYTPRDTAYKVSKNIIEYNVKDYSKKILLDIHIDYGLFNVDQDIPDSIKMQEGMKIVLGKTSPNYKENNKFAELLLKELKASNTVDTPTSIIAREGKYNQDLSAKALLINLGTSNATEEDIEIYLNSLTKALKQAIPQLK